MKNSVFSNVIFITVNVLTARFLIVEGQYIFRWLIVQPNIYIHAKMTALYAILFPKKLESLS